MDRHMRRLGAAGAGAHAGSLLRGVPLPWAAALGGTASLPRAAAIAPGIVGAFFAAAVAAAAIVAEGAVVLATSGCAERAG